MEDLQSKILKESELNGTIIVGIAGVGGVGKSALAKFLYNLKRSDFTRSCYLSEVREKGIASLQHKLIRDLLGYDLHIDNTSQGKGILRDRLGGLAVLVVSDDVDHFEQINSLLVTDRVGSGSLILITSRDQDLLRRCSPKIVLYNVKALQGKDARELFCRHAFLQSEPYKGFEDLVEKCLRICDGLPLCLQVLGAQLHRGRANRRYWELQLEKFSRCLPDDIIERLKVSYETLSNQEKEMFLDIGCFLAGEDKDLVFRVLEGLGYSDAMDCLESPRQKSLVEYHYDDFPSYDDDEIEYLRKNPRHDMKYITLGPGCLQPPRNGSKFKYRTTTTTLKVTMRDHVKKMAKQIARKEIFVLPAPKPLRLSCSNDIQAMLNWQPPWHLSELNIDVSGTVPSTSSSRRAFDAVAHSHKNISDGGAEEGEAAPYYFQFRFLQWIGTSMKFLNKIVLKNITFLQSLPIDFSELKSLRHLDLSGCINLTKLPNSFSKLMHLQYLALRDCNNLSMPTDILGEISTLEYVDLEGCAELVHLPSAMAYQRSLRYLNLLRTNLLQLPMNLELLDMLEQLRIGSSQLTELKHCIGDLVRLEELILIECHCLKHVLPEEISGPNIKVLVIEGSPVASFIVENRDTMDVGFRGLRYFTLKKTSISEISIPEGLYCSLETLDLSENFRLMQINVLPSSLVRLSLQNCLRLKTATNISNLLNLKFLNINGCVALETLNVEGLRIRGLSQLEWLNCLHISSNNGLIWNDISHFLASHENLSAAIFSAKADDKSISNDQEVRYIMGKFKVKMVDIIFDTPTSEWHMKIENFHSHSAILLCFISPHLPLAKIAPLRVRFGASSYDATFQEYTTLRYRGERTLHVFIWTDESSLFKDYKGYRDIDVYCSDDSGTHSTVRLGKNASELDAGSVKMGWLLMVDKNIDVSKVGKEFIIAFA